MNVLAVVLGAGVGGGIVALAWTWCGGRPTSRWPRRRIFPDLPSRLVRAVVAAVAAGLLTRWPVAVLAAGGFGFFSPDLLGGGRRRRADVERTEAIAAWAEMLRDTIAAVSGLEEAVVATAPLVPLPVRPAIDGLVHRLERTTLSSSLGQLADELDDPIADLVVAALDLAARGEARELGDLLSSLAEVARDTAAMRVRVDAVRARTRTAVRIISGVTVAMMALLLVLNRSYLRPFDTGVGQATLVLVFSGFAAGLVWLQAMSRYQAPERFVVAPSAEGGTG